MSEITEPGHLHNITIDTRSFHRFKRLLFSRRGIELEAYKEKYVQRRIISRMRAVKVRTLSGYLKFLSLNPDEWDSFSRSLTTRTTHFFRNPQTFRLIKEKILPIIIADKINNNKKTLSFWSAGCATGEEPFSLAILIKDMLGDNFTNFKVLILATDRDETSLSQAREGLFPQNRMKEIDQKLLGKYFIPQGNNFRLADMIKKMVFFEKKDIFKEKREYGHFDIIMCRNLFIYLSLAQQNKLLSHFHHILNVNGIMVLGKTESLPSTDKKFETISLEEKIFRKIE